MHIFILFVNRNFVLYYDHKCSLTTPQQYTDKLGKKIHGFEVNGKDQGAEQGVYFIIKENEQ